MGRPQDRPVPLLSREVPPIKWVFLIVKVNLGRATRVASNAGLQFCGDGIL